MEPDLDPTKFPSTFSKAPVPSSVDTYSFLKEINKIVSSKKIKNVDKEKLIKLKEYLENEDLEYYSFDGTSLGKEVNERIKTFMKGAQSVEVKKPCRLAGLGTTSKKCYQGDISNLEIKPIKEVENRGYTKYSVVMLGLDIPNSTWNKIISFIDEEDLFKPDKGFGLAKDFPHVTVLYGLHVDEVDYKTAKDTIVVNPTEISLKFDEIDIFENGEYDVVKLTIKRNSKLLKQRAELEKLPHTKIFPEYKPHITIAYVKPGLGVKYKKKFKNKYLVKGKEFVFSDDKEKERKL